MSDLSGARAWVFGIHWLLILCSIAISKAIFSLISADIATMTTSSILKSSFRFTHRAHSSWFWKNNTCYLSSESSFIVISDHWIVLFLVFLEVNYSESLKDTVSHFKFDIGDVHQPIITCHVLDVGGIAYEIHFIQSNKWIWEYMMSGY